MKASEHLPARCSAMRPSFAWSLPRKNAHVQGMFFHGPFSHICVIFFFKTFWRELDKTRPKQCTGLVSSHLLCQLPLCKRGYYHRNSKKFYLLVDWEIAGINWYIFSRKLYFCGTACMQFHSAATGCCLCSLYTTQSLYYCPMEKQGMGLWTGLPKSRAAPISVTDVDGTHATTVSTGTAE